MSIRVVAGSPPRFIDTETGQEVDEATARPLLSARQENRLSIETKARAALQSNRAFLAKQSPTNAELAQQIRSLTRQANGLLRVAILQDLTEDDT